MHRRHFLRLASSAPLASALHLHATPPHQDFAYLGTPNTLQTYAVHDNHWTKLDELPCDNPSSLVRHPTLPILYATNEVESFHNRPAGAVSVYSIAPDGRLALIQQKPLSLSATLPRAIALSPDGTHAIVAASGAGIYNLFALHPDGQFGPLRGILKETGSGPHPQHQTSSHPEHLCFDHSGHILAADRGTDRVHILSPTNNSLHLTRRYQASPGSGPAHLTLHPKAPFIALSHTLQGAITIHAYNPTQGLIGPQLDFLRGNSVPLQTNTATLAVKDGTRLKLYRWSPYDGRLQHLRSANVDSSILTAQMHENTLFVATANQVRRLDLATDNQNEAASTPGLRVLLWPRTTV